MYRPPYANPNYQPYAPYANQQFNNQNPYQNPNQNPYQNPYQSANPNSDLNPNKVYETNSESTNIINPTPTSGKYCKYCGSSNQLESKFCQSCGARLE